MSLSSSSRSGRVLSSDLLGTVALWEAEEGADDEFDTAEDEKLDEKQQSNWKLHLLDSKRLSKNASLVGGGEEGEQSRHRVPSESSRRASLPESFSLGSIACYVTQIHPTAPLFAATGAWAGATIYSCGNDDSNEQLGTTIRHFSDHKESSRPSQRDKASGAFGQSIAFDPRGDVVAVGTDKGVVSLYDVESGATLAMIQNQSAIIRALDFTQSGELLVGSDQCNVTIYDLRLSGSVMTQVGNGSQATSHENLDASYVDTLKGHDFWITDVKAAPDGSRHVGTSSADGQIKVWDLRGEAGRSVVFQTKEEKPVWSLCWKPDAGSSSFVTGSGIVKRASGGSSSAQAKGNVRWYQISGTPA